MTIFVKTDLHADYYNNKVEVWEPMVENWSVELNVCIVHTYSFHIIYPLFLPLPLPLPLPFALNNNVKLRQCFNHIFTMFISGIGHVSTACARRCSA